VGRIENAVFLSYRRTNATWALAIFQNLTHNGFDVFFDFDGIGSGDFLNVPLEAVLHPPSPSARQAAEDQRAAAVTLPDVTEQKLSLERQNNRATS
jgi:hypothetical protein